MIKFNTNHKTNEVCILSNNIKYIQQYYYRYFIILDEEYLQILKFVNKLYIIGEYKYIDFSDLNNDFINLKILCENLKYINLPHNIYSNTDININKSLKYLDILNIKDLDIDYINDYIGENLITIKLKYSIIENLDIDYLNEISFYRFKRNYIPILKTIIF